MLLFCTFELDVIEASLQTEKTILTSTSGNCLFLRAHRTVLHDQDLFDLKNTRKPEFRVITHHTESEI